MGNENEIIEVTGKDMIELARRNGALEESIRRNAQLIDENTKKAEELEKKIVKLNVEYDNLKSQVTELDGTVHKGTQSAKPLTQQVAVMTNDFANMKKTLYFIATMSVTAAIQLVITVFQFFANRG